MSQSQPPGVELGPAVDALDERDLARVIRLVGDEPHEDRLAGVELDGVATLAPEDLSQRRRGPAFEAALHHAPR